ncbi:unnamed protein product [Rotaria sp. Silwood2]|nr:unnamed protein product [Rotaria sp. Silwood2]
MADDGPKCYCRPGWMGKRCDDIRKPAANPRTNFDKSAQINPRATICPTEVKGVCENGGTCYLDNDNQLNCICPTNFLGDFCEIKDETQTTPQIPPGATTPIPAGQTTSSSGPIQPITPNDDKTCADRPCQNSSTCYNTGNSYYCFCGAGFTGRNCEQPSSG